MLVILRENVENLGMIGDVVRVRPGYARNFLLPKGLVSLANENNVRELEHHKRTLEKRRLAQKAASQELADKVSAHSCTIARKVGQNDRLFGSVTAQDVADELVKAGFQISKRMVRLNDSIKALGVHSVTVRLQPEVEATVKVWVVKDESAN